MDITRESQIIARRKVDPRGVWMRQNLRTRPFDAGRFAAVPMNALRIATIVANARGGAA